ncbi:MAG: hypothetical protein NTU44_14670, partial [Bacteroidetes bacterium]|nr:hypothetical protein [Bacteroidota bacterium]
KNLNVGTFIYGVGDQTNNYVIEKFCYHNEIANCNAFGGLYQWWELMDYDTIASSQGICPSGWHVPSNPEWDQIINYLGGYGVAGAALKAGGGSGFEALLAGWVFNCQKFRQMGVQAFFWSSSIYSYSSLYAWSRILSWNGNNVVSMYENQNDGLSVRCLKD